MTKTPARVRITDVGAYPNLQPALGAVVPCETEELLSGIFLYHVKVEEFKNLGCNIGDDSMPFPFYATEVETL